MNAEQASMWQRAQEQCIVQAASGDIYAVATGNAGNWLAVGPLADCEVPATPVQCQALIDGAYLTPAAVSDGMWLYDELMADHASVVR